jgi:hypothetical protein
MAEQSDYFTIPEFYAPDLEDLGHSSIDQSSQGISTDITSTSQFVPLEFTHQNESFTSLQHSIDAANGALTTGAYRQIPAPGADMPDNLSCQTSLNTQPFGVDSATSFPPSAFSDWSSRNSSTVWTPARQASDPFDWQHISKESCIHEDPELISSSHGLDGLGGLGSYHSFAQGPHGGPVKNPYAMHKFPSELVHRAQHIQPTSEMTMQQSSSESLHSSYSPNNSSSIDGVDSQQQSSSDNEFKQPEAPLNIAARRKRPRPAAINGAALRSQSFMSALPKSPGKPQLRGPASPMRRIKSAGNNLDLARGRIQKITSASGQRSPLQFESFADAGAFGETPHIGLSRAQTASALSTTSLAPPTPLSPFDMIQYQPDIQCSSNDSEPAWTFNSEYPGCFAPTTTELQSDVASPPMTPMHADLQAGLNSFYTTHYSPGMPRAISQPWSHSVSEDALISPQFNTFNTPMHMPQPTHISSIAMPTSDIKVSIRSNQAAKENAQSSNPSQKTSTVASGAKSESTESKNFTEFHFHEPLPEQQPQPPQHGSSKPRNYIFDNQGPEDF